TECAFNLPPEEPDDDRTDVLEREDRDGSADQGRQQVDGRHDPPSARSIRSPWPSARRNRWMMRSWQARPVGDSPIPLRNCLSGKPAWAMVRCPPADPRSPKAMRVTSPALLT